MDDLKSKPKVRDEFTEKDKKPKVEEKTIITPAVLPEKPSPEVQGEEEPMDDLKSKPKVRDEFTEKDKKPKDDEKIIITPAVLPEREEEVSEEEEEVKPEPKKKLSKADLKPSVVIKVDTVADTKVAKRKKKLAEKEESLFGDDETDMKQKEKPKVRDIY